MLVVDVEVWHARALATATSTSFVIASTGLLLCPHTRYFRSCCSWLPETRPSLQFTGQSSNCLSFACAHTSAAGSAAQWRLHRTSARGEAGGYRHVPARRGSLHRPAAAALVIIHSCLQIATHEAQLAARYT
jgi:hypothetical protein